MAKTPVILAVLALSRLLMEGGFAVEVGRSSDRVLILRPFSVLMKALMRYIAVDAMRNRLFAQKNGYAEVVILKITSIILLGN